MSSTRVDQETEDVWPGCVYAWLCTSATVEGLARGRACWAAGQIGESAHPGQRVSAKDPHTGVRDLAQAGVTTPADIRREAAIPCSESPTSTNAAPASLRAAS